MYQHVYSETADVDAALEAVRQAAEAHGGDLMILQGKMQNFYGPYFQLLQQALQQQGIDCTVAREQAITFGDDGLLHVDDEVWQPQTLLDFPILWRALKKQKTYGPIADFVVASYNNDALTTLYPPQPHLSSKLLLARASEAGIFGEHLPQSLLCTNEADTRWYFDLGIFCIKAAVSSGMKGLWLPDSSDLVGLKYPAIAQRLVGDQYVFNLTHASGQDTDWHEGQFVARLSLYVAADGTLAAADIAAQPYTGAARGIHGNPDCVLAPVKLR